MVVKFDEKKCYRGGRYLILFLGIVAIVACRTEKSAPSGPENQTADGKSVSQLRSDTLERSQKERRERRMKGLGEADDHDLVISVKEELETDADSYLVYLSGIPSNERTPLISKVLEDYICDLPGEDALAAFELISANKYLTNPLAVQVLSRVARDEPKMAVEWLEKNSADEVAAMASYSIGQELVNHGSPEKVLDELLEGALPIDLKAKVMAGGVTNWLSLDEDEVFEHFSWKGDDPRLDQAYYEIVSIAKSRDTEGAMEWAALIGDDETKKKAMLETAEQWQQDNPEMYQAWKAEKAPQKFLDELP